MVKEGGGGDRYLPQPSRPGPVPIAMNVCVLITAAGSSSRFGFGDKLAQDLGGRAVLLRSVEAFTKRDEVRSILVAAPPDSIDEFRDRYGGALGFHGASIVAGGRTERWESVRNALAAVPEECTHVAVHDAARPGVSDAVLDRVFAAAAVHAAVIPGLAVRDTLKRVGEQMVAGGEDDAIADMILGDAGKPQTSAKVVEATVDRRNLFAVQTPQVFRREVLVEAYAKGNLEGVTDDASVVERAGVPVVVVEGDPRNLKITTPEDLELLRTLLGAKSPEGRATHKRF
jgi:2-C-methyl-D-erythritol 4-phosphate cytidylyltransferase